MSENNYDEWCAAYKRVKQLLMEALYNAVVMKLLTEDLLKLRIKCHANMIGWASRD